MLTTSQQACRLKALTVRHEEIKRGEPSEAVIAACDAVIRMTDKSFNSFAEKSQPKTEGE